MFLQNFHIFINKRAMLRQKFTVQVTTLPDCDDITRFDGTHIWMKKAGKVVWTGVDQRLLPTGRQMAPVRVQEEV